MPTRTEIQGYTFGKPEVARSPVSLEELARLEKTLLFEENDREALRMSRDILADQVESVLDTWYGFLASVPHLIEAFAVKGKPDPCYLAAVRERFGQWILDTAAAEFDQRWLDYQHEIGLRHHRTKKNLTDKVDAAPIVPLRYLLALVYPVTQTLRPFLASHGASPADVDRMHAAWTKAVLLQVILWSRPYVDAADF